MCVCGYALGDVSVCVVFGNRCTDVLGKVHVCVYVCMCMCDMSPGEDARSCRCVCVDTCGRVL